MEILNKVEIMNKVYSWLFNWKDKDDFVVGRLHRMLCTVYCVHCILNTKYYCTSSIVWCIAGWCQRGIN